jgi:alpha-1,3-rhamnosyl/mannosyltransferase
VETLAGRCDVAHASGPLLLPSRRAAQVITIHDLDFLHHPERTSAEMHRDFLRHIREHAGRADHIVVSSHYAAGEVARALEVDAGRISVCSPGAPAWAPDVVKARTRNGPGSTILFLGTVEPRKNIGALLEAYGAVVATHGDAPRLVIAGGLPDAAARQLSQLEAGIKERVDVLGYVPASQKPRLYAEARMLVLPSFEEGFGLPVLEAMACGVPVVVSDRGSLPEVAGNAADPVDPHDIVGLAARMIALLDDDLAAEATARGFARAAQYSWAACAEAATHAYAAAVERRAR